MGSLPFGEVGAPCSSDWISLCLFFIWVWSAPEQLENCGVVSRVPEAWWIVRYENVLRNGSLETEYR